MNITTILNENPLFKTILNQANMGIYVLDTNGLFSFVNHYFHDLYGSSDTKFENSDPLELIVPEEREKLRQKLKSHLTGTNERESYISRAIKNKGQEIDIALDVASLRNNEGQIIGVLGFVRDITQHVQTMKERKRFEEQALMIEKLAALGRLATTVVHQINNPLEAIKNYLYLLKGECGQVEANKDMIEKIEHEVFRIAKLTRQIVEFAVPTSTKFPALDIVCLLEETLFLMDKKIRTYNVTVSEDFVDPPPQVQGSPYELKQAFLNIIFNALEAMPEGGTLSLDVENIGSNVEIRISDTGSGITKENLKKIFDPFFSTKDPAQYMGLGLSVSFHIIHNHGGAMRVESEPHKGSCVIISLPISSS
ncbi:nitrogen regulation protein NR(II) [candidate division CSSED10-310 bacterium]|uniref:histidine kinase n=1 Tax=candidate division CSSED10-310 bacterium TaxID=2855610 RepID=A0ABV6YTV2_UNCC1